VPLQITAVTVGTPINMLVVQVTAADIPTPLVFNLTVTNGVASGTLKIPPGPARTILVRAFDTNGNITHEGSVTFDVRPGQNPMVQCHLTPRVGQVPITVTFGSYGVTVTPPAATIDVTVTRQLQLAVAVTDANGQVISSPSVEWATSNPAVATVSAAGLVTGASNGVATIVATYEGVGGSSQVTVTGAGAIELSPANIVFAAAAKSTDPEPQIVMVTDTGGGVLTGVTAAVTYASGSGWLTASLDVPSTPATLTLDASTATLPAGDYSATVRVSASGAEPKTITVSLSVVKMAEIGLSPTALEFAFGDVDSAANPEPQKVAISNVGIGSMTGVTATIAYQTGVSGATGWLNTSLSGDSLMLQANRAGFQLTGNIICAAYTCRYHATVSIASPDARNSPQTVAVTLAVTRPATGLPFLPPLPDEAPTLTTSISKFHFVTLYWTYEWGNLDFCSCEAFLVEESTQSASSGFRRIDSIPAYHAYPAPRRDQWGRLVMGFRDRALTLTLGPTLQQPSGPNPGNHWYRVRAQTIGGVTSYSAVQQTVVPSDAGPVLVARDAHKGVDLSWSYGWVSPPSDYYDAYVLEEAKFGGFSQVAVYWGRTTPYAVHLDLAVGKACGPNPLLIPPTICWPVPSPPYRFRVRVLTAYGFTDYSNEAAAVALP
jgi:hypothetical protein